MWRLPATGVWDQVMNLLVAGAGDPRTSVSLLVARSSS